MRHTIAEKVNDHVWVIINDTIRYVLVGEPNIPDNRDLMTLMPQRNIYIMDEDEMIIEEAEREINGELVHAISLNSD